MEVFYSSIKHHKLKRRGAVGAEGEEEIGDSQEPLRIILLAMVWKKKYLQFHFYYHVHGNYIIDILYAILKSSATAIFFLV